MPNKWFVVDAHNQFIPEEGVKKSRGMSVDLTNIDNPKVAPFKRTLDMEAKIRVMDEAGVDMALIHMASLNVLGLDFCRAMNDGNANVAKKYPGRIIPLAHIPLEGGGSQAALDEVERSVNVLGLKGIALENTSGNLTIGSEELFPLYEKISRVDVPVVLHPGMGMGGISSVGLKGDMLRAVGVEIENTKAAVEAMVGVLMRFPDIKFLLPHHGGALPIWQGRMRSGFLPEGWKVPDEFKGLPRTPRIRRQMGLEKAFTALFEKLYFDTSGFQGWMPITQAALLAVRADRLCLGTDYGFEMLESQDIKGFIDDIKKLKISETDKRNILGENIRRLFKV